MTPLETLANELDLFKLTCQPGTRMEVVFERLTTTLQAFIAVMQDEVERRKANG